MNNGLSSFCPENRTYFTFWPLTWLNRTPRPATISPATGVPIMIQRSAGVRTRTASFRIPAMITAAASPTRIAQPNSAILGRLRCGRPGSASEKVPKPVQCPRPVKTSAPTPEASRPGRSTSSSIALLKPAASMSRNAPTSGEPSKVLMAAKLPAAPSTTTAWLVSPLTACLTAHAHRPPPSAISGASGPSTAPQPSVISAAIAMPGRSLAGARPPTVRPSAGLWPPVPGRYLIVAATPRPPRRSSGNGHQTGIPWNPSCPGSRLKSHRCSLSAATRKK